jgi:hypothetical protein
MIRRAVVLALLVAAVAPVSGARAGDGGDGPAAGCIDGSAQEDAVPVAFVAGDGGDALTFTESFFPQVFTLDVSTDGIDGHDLTISIETICHVPKGYEAQATQLAGLDGVAVISSKTKVYMGKQRLKGAQRTAQLGGADTMHLTVRLAHQKKWRAGEDDPVPTFVTRRADITD